jgi:hypothetical protein
MLNQRRQIEPEWPARQAPTPQPEPPKVVSLKPVIYGLAVFLVLFVGGWHLKARAPQPSIVLLPQANPSIQAPSPLVNVPKIIEVKSELPAHSLRKWPLPMSKRATIRWHLEAAAPVRLLVFQTPNDAAKYLAHQPYSTYNCSEPKIQLSDSMCTVEPQAMLALENPTDASVKIALSVTSPDHK